MGPISQLIKDIVSLNEALTALGCYRDPMHHLDCFHRELADSRFAAQHDRIRAIKDRVGHITGLGSRRTRILNHLLEHLCRSDHHYMMFGCGLNDLFLC